ncbi:disease resistance protein RGA2 [Setaria italica]|uniref:disease resistance protein RGA2 n=1 Tax=Setaria italica TaxID=4555 RepID=UPI000BE5335A|nr:disease resistance protein RGA2 [Setaria italica]
MEKFVSAVLGDLVSRSVSFVVNTCYRQKGVEEYLPRLRGVLLQIQATVEEAEGRHITNQAMLRQLQMLREAMYKGCYLLDNFTYRMLHQKRNNDQVSGHPFALSIHSPAKRLCSSTRRMGVEFQGDGLEELQEMLRSLHSIMDDMSEFIIFLKSYPHISREPYSEYLFMEKCMFGRQAEMDKIMGFLLKPEPPGAQGLQVLPIIGPPRVGKSTLVEHVCYDERVRNHFSSIILCSGDPTAAPKGMSGIVKKQTHGSHGRSLVVMELADGLVIDERECRKLYSSASHMPPGSKVIVTSRSDNILKLGTTGAIRLDFLSQEAYWYFFKVIAFGSTNPDDHPELASIAMEIAEELDRSFLSANLYGGFLRDKPSISKSPSPCFNFCKFSKQAEKRQQDISLCSPSVVKFKVIGNLKGALKIQSHSSVLAVSASVFHSPAFAMEALVSAVLGDLISRSISFAVDRCCHRRRKGGIEDSPLRLRRVLLRVQAVVEEADRRRVTNQAMLRQLQLMREGVYRGYYLLSAFKSQGAMQGKTQQDREVSHSSSSFALSQFNPAKRLCTVSARTTTANVASDDTRREGDAEAELREVLTSLERMANDMKELVVFLSCYPPTRREPYSGHLWLENRMFGREAEQERIMSFLLETEPPVGTEDLGVLPVIGRARVGKSTLVEHVC